MKTAGNRFPLGKTLITPGALEVIREASEHPIVFLNRHQKLDQGVLGEEDHQANLDALEDGGRVFSAFLTKTNIKLWVITEADRSATTILLPEEY